MAAIDAAVTERFARIGDKVSTSASESRGLACLGTMIVDPGNKSFAPNPKNDFSNFIEVPLGKIA